MGVAKAGGTDSTSGCRYGWVEFAGMEGCGLGEMWAGAPIRDSEGGSPYAAMSCRKPADSRRSHLPRHGFAPCLGGKGVGMYAPGDEGGAHLCEGGLIHQPCFDQLCSKL